MTSNTNTNASSLPDMEENNSQILNDIQSLQTIEQELFNNLENQPDLSTDQQQQIISKINNISNMRVNLYQTLGGVNDFFKTFSKDVSLDSYLPTSEFNESVSLIGK